MAWDAGIEAVDIVKARIKKYKINCDLKWGTYMQLCIKDIFQNFMK